MLAVADNKINEPQSNFNKVHRIEHIRLFWGRSKNSEDMNIRGMLRSSVFST